MMNRILIILMALSAAFCSKNPTSDSETAATAEAGAEKPAYAIVIHGGAGTILPENITGEQEAAYRKALNAALTIGEDILKAGGSSRDAVEQTIIYLEDSPLFNAGKGAVFTSDGQNELDASIMDGATRNAGAVGGLHHVRNPIRAARAVLEHSRHVLLTGAGAETFAIEQGLDTVPADYFYTESRWNALERARAAENQKSGALLPVDYKYGTVGCVALDKAGNITAGTSTGGMTNKRYGRFGDVPVIGAGTYADNATCGVSCTGHGEYFIRYAVGHDMTALMAYKGMSLEAAGQHIIHEKLKKAGGAGGLIAIDKNGNITMPFNTPGMYRGYARPGEREVGLFGAMAE
jgi:beta-aspartyl-peptidase (threonine type)